MIREKTFYRTFFALTLSLALQNLLTYGVNMMDTVMLGRYSQDAMGGVSLCNQVQFLLQMLVVGAGEGAVVLGAQYWGKGDLAPIPHIIGVALRFGGTLAAALFMVVLWAPERLLSLLSNEPAVIAQGVRYFQIICFTYVIFTLTNILVASLRSIGIVKIGYVISFSTLCINVFLNYCLIYGHFGLPELGVRGAAIATLVSRCVELGIVFYYLKYRERRLHLSLRSLVHIDVSYVRDYGRVSAPVLINQALWGVAQMVQTGILGHLGGDVTAANAIAVQVYQVLSVVSYGAASASGIVVGKTIGAGKREDLKGLVFTLQVIFVALGLSAGGAIFLLRGPIPAGVRRGAHGAGGHPFHAVHGSHGRHHSGHLLSDGLRQRHYPRRRGHRLQREDEPCEHVAHCGSPLRHGGVLVAGGAGDSVLFAEMGSAL